MLKMKILAYALLIFGFTGVSYAQFAQTVVSLTGNVFNEVTRQPETVAILCFDIEGNRVNATRSNISENGYYYLTGLRPGMEYIVELKKKGFFKETYKIQVPDTKKYLEISQDFLIKPLEKDIKIPVRVPPFELNKSKLRFGSEFFLEDLANTLKENPDVKFEIISFPDNAKDKNENKELTLDRAKSLMQYFASQGISQSRMTIEGSATVDPNNPPPVGKRAKGKRYIGPSYIVVKNF